MRQTARQMLTVVGLSRVGVRVRVNVGIIMTVLPAMPMQTAHGIPLGGVRRRVRGLLRMRQIVQRQVSNGRMKGGVPSPREFNAGIMIIPMKVHAKQTLLVSGKIPTA
jgi:hypothetical protein